MPTVSAQRMLGWPSHATRGAYWALGVRCPRAVRARQEQLATPTDDWEAAPAMGSACIARLHLARVCRPGGVRRGHWARGLNTHRAFSYPYWGQWWHNKVSLDMLWQSGTNCLSASYLPCMYVGPLLSLSRPNVRQHNPHITPDIYLHRKLSWPFLRSSSFRALHDHLNSLRRPLFGQLGY